MKRPPIIISLGGSLIVPKTGIDIAFLKQFKSLISRRITKGDRFVIICGGGSTARRYQLAAGAVDQLTHEDID